MDKIIKSYNCLQFHRYCAVRDWSTVTSIAMIFIINFLLPVQCGGRKAFPFAINALISSYLTLWLCVRNTLMHLASTLHSFASLRVVTVGFLFLIGFWNSFVALQHCRFWQPIWKYSSKQHRWRAFSERSTCLVHHFSFFYNKRIHFHTIIYAVLFSTLESILHTGECLLLRDKCVCLDI